jgi:nucleoside-diphosphate-sugar epimerase
MKNNILVIGASGQIGTELIVQLRKNFGEKNVIAADVKTPSYEVYEGGPYEIADVLDVKRLAQVIQKHKVGTVYQLAALLSATAEQNPAFAWKLNMDGLFNVLEMAKRKIIHKIFWPSSIAVFGPNTPKQNTPQFTVCEPSTVYGISKLAGERWCEYYYYKHNVDVRSIRYPGLIGYKSQPGGGTTDYSVHIFHEALRKKKYKCFLGAETMLPMMYMPDAINATIDITEAPSEKIKIRGSYNIASISFNPNQLASEIKKHIPQFKISYEPDVRQTYADSWPDSIDDSYARKDWGWKHKYTMPKMVSEMLRNLKKH